jgi:hypothetical protein
LRFSRQILIILDTASQALRGKWRMRQWVRGETSRGPLCWVHRCVNCRGRRRERVPWHGINDLGVIVPELNKFLLYSRWFLLSEVKCRLRLSVQRVRCCGTEHIGTTAGHVMTSSFTWSNIANFIPPSCPSSQQDIPMVPFRGQTVSLTTFSQISRRFSPW